MIFKKFVDWSDFGKISKIQILPNCHQSRGKNSGMIFHAFRSIYLPILSEKIFDPNLDQVWPNFDKNFDLKKISFHPKMEFVKMHWFPEYELFISLGAKVIPLGAFEPPKANFTMTLRPLKLQIGENVFKPIKVRPKVLVFAYPHTF